MRWWDILIFTFNPVDSVIAGISTGFYHGLADKTARGSKVDNCSEVLEMIKGDYTFKN